MSTATTLFCKFEAVLKSFELEVFASFGAKKEMF